MRRCAPPSLDWPSRSMPTAATARPTPARLAALRRWPRPALHRAAARRRRPGRPCRAGPGTLRTPLCLDESITSAADARRAIALGACGVINIKAGRVGRLSRGGAHPRSLCGPGGAGVVRRHARDRRGPDRQPGPGRLSKVSPYRATCRPPTASTARTSPSPSRSNTDGTIDVPDGPGTGAVLRSHVLDDSVALESVAVPPLRACRNVQVRSGPTGERSRGPWGDGRLGEAGQVQQRRCRS